MNIWLRLLISLVVGALGGIVGAFIGLKLWK